MSKLTPNERLILFNQFRILQALKVGEFGHYLSILEHGDVSRYGDIHNELRGEIPEDVSRFVGDVLSLYRMLNDADKDIYFPGFDGNNEGTYYSAARLTIGEKNSWDEQKPFKSRTDGWNSHSQMVPFYKKQLEKYAKICARTGKQPYDSLTKDEAKEIDGVTMKDP